MFSIYSIVWPDENIDALHLYLKFLIESIENSGFYFLCDNAINPIDLTKKYIYKNLTENERDTCRDIWWDFIDNASGIRDFSSKDMLSARLALCLLVPSANKKDELSENLSWFLEVMQMLGLDVDKIIENMRIFFKENI